ncbi:MAG: hypothetical protein WCT20_01710 [Candidatus Babeliales bacterium]
MKKLSSILSVVLVGVLAHGSSFADVKFSSNNAAISVASGARLIINAPSLRVDGTIIKDAGASILGNQIDFNHGIFNTDGVDVLLTASYSPNTQSSINLLGSGRFVAPPGYIVQAINVGGNNNRIEGQPLLLSPITLYNSSSSVGLALQNALDQNIILNGGSIYLDSDLALADDTLFSGSGTITLSGHHLTLGGFYTQSWNGTLLFNNASDLILSGSVLLNSSWTFSGVSVINGNGSILDLSGGGSIIIENGSSLSLNDLTLTGIGEGAGSIIFNGASSQLFTNNAVVRVIANTTTSTGNVYVQGPTTFIMSNNSWLFENNGKLTVDGSTLWIDQIDAQSFIDGIKAPFPLYGTTGIEEGNISSDIAAGNLEFLNNGIVRMVSQGGGSVVNPLSGSLTSTVVFGSDVFLTPKDYIKIDGNIMIDGGGAAIHFSNPTSPLHSQLIISQGKVLTLRNVRLLNLSTETFDFRNNARLNIDSNVLVELSQDITFSSGLIKLSGDGLASDVFTVQGRDGQRKMAIAPTIATPIPILQLGTNTLLLENIELSGFGSISHINDVISGAVALTHDSCATLSCDSAMNFVIEGSSNDFVLQKDGINLSGNISFGDSTDNELHIRFALDTALDSQLQTQYGAQVDNPIVIFSGDPGVYLSSYNGGLARLFFDDASLSLVNAGSNSFVIDAESYLGCRNLEILGNAIKQSSALFTFNAIQLSGLQIDPSFIRLPSEITRSLHVLPTALHLKRQKEREELEKIMQASQAKQKEKIEHKPAAKPTVKPKKGKPKRQTRGFDDFDSDDSLCMTRDIRTSHIPATFDQHYFNMTFIPSSPLSGNLEFDAAVVSNVSVSDTVPFNIVLKNASRFDQGVSDIVFGANHEINIVGAGNVINVTKSMTIESNLFFEQDAEVTFNFINTGQSIPTLIFAARSTVDLPQGSIIRFSGAGNVIFQNGVTLNYQGIKDVHNLVSQRPRFIVTDGAVVSLAESARVTMKGIGRVEVAQRGAIDMNYVGALIFGGTATYVERTSDFQLSVAGTGFINLAPIDIPTLSEQQIESRGVARISFQRTTVEIDIENSGMLLIGDSGRFEINAEGDTLKQGKIETLNFHNNCFINMSGTGRFVLGENTLNQALATPIPFSWDGRLMGRLFGDGFVRYIDIDPTKGFIGKLSLTTDPYYLISEISSERLASILVQCGGGSSDTSSVLRISTVYIDHNGSRVLRTVKGISVVLQDGDVIVSDDWHLIDCHGRPNPFYGYVDGFDVSGFAFRYTPDGNRI